MTGLAQDRASDGGVGHPVGSRDPRRIDSTVQDGGNDAASERSLLLDVERCEAPVEADRELPAGLLHGPRERPALVLGERHRLLHEHVLPGLERGEGLPIVVLVSAQDEHDVDLGVA